MPKKVLTIGGSDPFAGGGIQTDLKTFENHQVFGLSALTCIATASQNQFAVHDLAPELLAEQLASIPKNYLDAIKIGLIHDVALMPIIKEFLKDNNQIPVVLDPVFAFKETTETYAQEYIHALQELFPLTTIITPNLIEAAQLSKLAITSEEQMAVAAKKIVNTGANAVAIKGGTRLPGPLAIDFVYDGQYHPLTEPKISAVTINGAGCGFSSAIAANLALGYSLVASVSRAKSYVYESIIGGVLIEETFGSVWHGGQLAGSEED